MERRKLSGYRLPMDLERSFYPFVATKKGRATIGVEEFVSQDGGENLSKQFLVLKFSRKFLLAKR
jgi:hypothetical protein